MRIGATFSATHARWLGLDAPRALARMIELGLDPLRLCGYWNRPLDDLDWQLEQAAAARRQVLLTVGMKAPRWPEFHFPEGRSPDLRRGGEIGPATPIAPAVLAHLRELVERFRDQPAIAGWQVENEPSNRSGPKRWWISPDLLAQEVAAVREGDDRPLALTAFGHFDRVLDELSGHALVNVSALRGRGSGVEPELLDLLRRGDILGLDLYHSIGHREGFASHAGAPGPYLERCRSTARERGVECWVTELQAEPWEATSATQWDPKSVAPGDVADRLHEVGDGIETVLLWGVEYWLAQAERGNLTWLDAGRAVLGG
ncbi:MAG: hypothetical protein ACREQM_08125 [Candidatus Dormibacteraceae bacterium]